MNVAAIEGHRLWAPTYNSGLNPLLALERQAMRALLKPLHPATMIDVACGTGQWLLNFQNSGADVFGCDACEEMLKEAAKSGCLRGRIALAEAECIPVRREVADLVLCSLSLGYFQNINHVFREFGRVSKPGGFIAVSDLHPDALACGWSRSFKVGEQRYDIENHQRTIEDVKGAALEAGLTPKSCRPIYFGPSEFPVFQRAGKQDLFETVKRIPALFTCLWKKPC